MDNKENNKALSTAAWIKLILVIAVALFLVYRCFLPFRAEYAFREAYNAKARKNIPLAITKYRKAVKLAPWETHYAVQLGKIFEDLARSEKDPDKKIAHIIEAHKIYENCLKISPKNPWYHNRVGEVYNLYASIAKTPEEKLEWQKKREEKIVMASQIDKNNALFQMSVAYMYHRNKEYDKAIEKYQHVLVIDDRFAEAYFNMADIFRIRSNEEKQIEMYQMIFEKKPAFKNAHMQLGRI